MGKRSAVKAASTECGSFCRWVSVVTTTAMILWPPVAFAQQAGPPAGITNIVPDGRTATQVQVNGSVSTVTDLPPLKWSSLRYGFDHGGYDGEEEAYG